MSKPTFDINVGDMDTPLESPSCPSVWADGGADGYSCTREVNHPGNHAAGTGLLVVATWDDEGNYEEMPPYDPLIPSTDHIPAQYLASTTYGDLPEARFATAGEAWRHLLGSVQNRDAVERVHTLMRAGDPGRVADQGGSVVHQVEDTWIITCGICERKFPNIYPPGRCPYELWHPDEILASQMLMLGLDSVARVMHMAHLQKVNEIADLAKRATS